MRVFPKNKWRLLVIAAVPILPSFFFHSPRWWAVEIRSHSAFLFHSRVTDQIETLSFWQEWWFERYLQQVADESGVDIRFLLVPNVDGESLEIYSVKKARALGVGRDAGRRGLLFVYDTSGQRLRLEVGAQLEGVITDAFAGYLMRDHVRGFFGAGNPQLGLFTTLLLVHHRLREGILGEEFDPRTVEFIQDARRLAVGGGASTVIQSMGPGHSSTASGPPVKPPGSILPLSQTLGRRTSATWSGSRLAGMRPTCPYLPPSLRATWVA